jgi:AcrR family transcriptional regulator
MPKPRVGGRTATTPRTNAERRRESEQQHRRQHLLMAAEMVFGRLPYDQASMQAVAEEAGIGMKGLYQQFASKEELLSAVVAFRLGEINERIKAAQQVANPIARLRHLAVTYSAFFMERPRFFPLFLSQKIEADWDFGSHLADPVRRGLRQVADGLRDTIAAGIDAGQLAPADAGLLAALATGFFIHATQYQLLVRRPRSAEACADELMELLVNGIGRKA